MAAERGETAGTRVSPYEKIKEAIVSGELAPGQGLVESSLAKWCGVSRTPVREALRRLEQDGLVSWNERGLVVRERSPEEILDIYEARILLEATAGRVAADRRTDHDVRLLRAAAQQCRNADAASPAEMVRANRAFHRAVWQAAHNEPLRDLLERLDLHLARFPATTLSQPGRWEAACAEHDQLVQAIELRAGEKAYEVGYAHFKAARDIKLNLYTEELGRL
ncbi:GntR family transcriptional regulator [Arthrobacter ginkgonis]|uniref:GntR family transcriptional regulator n=1 Tax=Arthrobacter ginkgonis TaxID=1630594 RepID=A0ABP7CD78_9MICC